MKSASSVLDSGRGLDRDLVRALQPCGAVDQADGLRLEQSADRVVEAGLDRLRPARAARRCRAAPSALRPMAWARVSSESSPPVAIIAFDGMQSHRCAAPPTTSRSIERDLCAERRRDRRARVARGTTADDDESRAGHANRVPAPSAAPVRPSLSPDVGAAGRPAERAARVGRAGSRRATTHCRADDHERGAGRLPVLPRPRGPDPSGAVPHGRRRAGHTGLARPRVPEPVPDRGSGGAHPAPPARTR